MENTTSTARDDWRECPVCGNGGYGLSHPNCSTDRPWGEQQPIIDAMESGEATR